MLEQLTDYLSKQTWISEALAHPLAVLILTAIILCGAIGLYAVLYNYLLKLINLLSRKTANQWDDALMDAGVFRRVVRMFPLLLIYIGVERLLVPFGSGLMLSRVVYALMILFAGRIVQAVLESARRIFSKSQVASYVQALTIVLYVFVTIFVVATLLGKSPWGLFSVLGGLTAVILLVFKDSILGFVAGVQLSANDMVRVGDWIEMPKYGADGDVIDVTLNTVKVQNWDKTISTIPPYALISDSFKNWRGMSESGGRRIKRSVNLDMNSIRFVDAAQIEKFRAVDFIGEYIEAKQKEIDEHNAAQSLDLRLAVNGRRQTNVGIFRAYLQAYLRNHSLVHDDMTFLVRQLQPTAQGLPIEIYVFCKDQVWANYEAIQADIFDHVLAALPEFGLHVFQNPTGADFRALSE